MAKTASMIDGPPASIDEHPDTERFDADEATVEALFSDLSELREENQAAETHDDIQDIKTLLSEAHARGLIESGVRDLRARDAVEAFVGSVIFASPLLVEDGVFEIADHLFQFTAVGIPVFLVLNTVFVVFMTYALLQWTGRDRAETHLLFGVVPVRVVMVLTVSFVVATLMMTVWGRVEGWQTPTEALARINVIWTVGSLGAALGDIIADTDAPPTSSEASPETRFSASDGPGGRNTIVEDTRSDPLRAMSDSALIGALHDEFNELETTVTTTGARQEVNRIREQTIHATVDGTFGDQIRKYTTRDIAEAFVGSIFFSIPFLVEDGVFDVADYFLSFQIGLFSVFFLVNTVFVFVMIVILVYWAGPQNVHVNRPIFGFIPRRLIGIAVVSFLTAAALMTMWGRVDDWQDPVVALARISVVWTVASFGAALGDILPGESSGADINDELAALGEEAADERG